MKYVAVCFATCFVTTFQRDSKELKLVIPTVLEGKYSLTYCNVQYQDLLQASLTKWLSVRLPTKWLWVRIPLLSLRFIILAQFRFIRKILRHLLYKFKNDLVLEIVSNIFCLSKQSQYNLRQQTDFRIPPARICTTAEKVFHIQDLRFGTLILQIYNY